jgi:NAD+ synthase
MSKSAFSYELLRVDPSLEVTRICSAIRELMRTQVKRQGLVVGLSGGIDSSLTAALAVRALGSKRVLGLEMPERHSAQETVSLSSLLAASLGISTVREDISQTLESVGFYQKYQDAACQVVPGYGAGWKSKIVISDLGGAGFSAFSLVAQDPDGGVVKKRIPFKPYLEIVAATNFKQRIRKMLEYYHADRLHFAVAGTPNRLEYDQGFFVKLGDGAADIKPIAHLYKSQVYQLAEYLDIPEQIRRRKPTTDTYSLEQGQDEFYFSLPYEQMDLCLLGKNSGVAPEQVAEVLHLSAAQVEMVYRDISVKRATTRYLHLPPLLVQEVGWQHGG